MSSRCATPKTMTMMTDDSVIGGTWSELRNDFENFQSIYIIYILYI